MGEALIWGAGLLLAIVGLGGGLATRHCGVGGGCAADNPRTDSQLFGDARGFPWRSGPRAGMGTADRHGGNVGRVNGSGLCGPGTGGQAFRRHPGRHLGVHLWHVIGMILGVFLLPGWGIIVGAFAGAVIGELWAGQSTGAALKAGWGVFLGNLLGVGLKLAYGVTVLVMLIRLML